MSINDLPKFACIFVQVLGFWKELLNTYCQDSAEESRYTAYTGQLGFGSRVPILSKRKQTWGAKWLHWGHAVILGWAKSLGFSIRWLQILSYAAQVLWFFTWKTYVKKTNFCSGQLLPPSVSLKLLLACQNERHSQSLQISLLFTFFPIPPVNDHMGSTILETSLRWHFHLKT